MFDTFGHDKVKKDIEVILLKNQRLYSVFFEWFYSEGFDTSNAKPNNEYLATEQSKEQENSSDEDDNATYSGYRNIKNSAQQKSLDDDFPLGDSYKAVNSRPKTTIGMLSSTEDRKDVDFDLSPSQSNSNFKLQTLIQSNQYPDSGDDEENNAKIGRFLTEEKNFSTLSSKNQENVDIDFEAIIGPPRISELKPEDISDRLATVPKQSSHISINNEKFDRKIKEENKNLLQEWEQRLENKEREHLKTMEALEKENERYKKEAGKKGMLQQELDEMKDLNERLIEKYEKALEANIEVTKRQKVLEEQREEERKQQELRQSPWDALSKYAESEINNPIDLSMSLALKPGAFSNQNSIKTSDSPLTRLSSILTNQRALRATEDWDSDSEEVTIESTFKLQEFLIENDDPKDIAQSLMLMYLKSQSSKEKANMLKSMACALTSDSETEKTSEDVLLSLTDVHFWWLLDSFLRFFAYEKVCLLKYKNGDDLPDEDLIDPDICSDNIRVIQKCISNLLNSKDYTITIKTLLKILREGLPEDFGKELSEERRQYLRALMKCLLKVVEVCEDEIRVFDILIEMNRLFKTHPPDVLRENLPSLEDFDYVYRCLKSVSDKMIEVQPDKVNDFLRFISKDKANSRTNSFIHYLVQVMASNINQ